MKHDQTQFKLLPSLPAGERLIWQGKPCVHGLAWRAFHVRELPLYFGAFLAWRLWTLHASNAPAAPPASGTHHDAFQLNSNT